MKMHKPSELRAFLEELGVHAKSHLSQNFLIDGNVIHKIVRTAEIQPNDIVLEIGPGPGALTEALLEQGASVIAIEMDPVFAEKLHRLQTPDQRLQVIQADVLSVALDQLLRGKKSKVVTNLPYHITTPILTRLLPLYTEISTLTLMVQKEFAERMIAKTNTSDYSSFTVFLQFYSTVVSSFIVSPNCFYPKPNVFSSVVHCQLHPPPLENDVEAFFQLTRSAFGKRRKMLRSSLKDLYSATAVEQALLKLGRPNTARPEQLSLKEFISLFAILRAF